MQGTAAPFTVVSHEDCVPITWDQATRTYTMTDPDDAEDAIPAHVVSLGSGLYLAQITVATDKPDKHQVHLFLSKGDAFAMLSALDDEHLQTLADKHRRLTFAKGNSGRAYISAGRVDHIKAFLKEAAKETLRDMKAEDEPVSIGIRDKAGAADHPADKKQTKDIEAVLRLARQMTPR